MVLSYTLVIKGNQFDSISCNNQFCYINFKDDIETVTFDNKTFINFVFIVWIMATKITIFYCLLFSMSMFSVNTKIKLGGKINFGSSQNSENVVKTSKKMHFHYKL